jgi:hypothetical protein
MKLNKSGLVLAVIVSSFLVGCSNSDDKKSNSGGGDNTVDASGNCTQSTIDSFNNLLAAEKSGDEKATVDSCNAFFAAHKTGVECKALSGGSEVSLNTTKLKTTCDAKAAAYAEKTKEKSSVRYCSDKEQSVIEKLNIAKYRYELTKPCADLKAYSSRYSTCRDQVSSDVYKMSVLFDYCEKNSN